MIENGKKKLRLLFLTNEEAGQINVHLATVYSLLQHPESEVELHLASFSLAEKKCPKGVTFHTIPGIGHGRHFLSAEGEIKGGFEEMIKQVYTYPGFFGTLKMLSNFSTVVQPEGPARYVETAKYIENLMDDIEPDFVVVDTFLAHGSDACARTKREYVFLSPNAWKDTAMSGQELGIFSWPFVATGWTHPLPWYLIPLNIICVLFLPLYLLFDWRFRALMAARKEAGYTGSYALLGRDAPILSLGTPALDYPGKEVPSIITVGPIVLPSPPVDQVDEELARWLDNPGMKTVLVSLGSHTVFPDYVAKEIFEALGRLIETRSDIQVLWKLRKAETTTLELGKYGERLKVVQWLKPDPISLLKSGKVICNVHHGGSNSFHETLSAGIPQIALSSWVDCHDFGTKIEWLGIGRWGNRKAAPFYSADEVFQALIDIVGYTPNSPLSAKIKARAEECSSIANRTGLSALGPEGEKVDWAKLFGDGDSDGKGAGVQGRDVAAEWIIRKARLSRG